MSKKLGLVLLLAVAVSLSLVSVAVAQSSSTSSSQQVYKAKLTPLNRSGASANATLTLEGRRRLTTKLESDDMAPKLPHAQHIHGFKKAVSECPTLAADQNGDRLINTVEGQPSYGPIRVSFTTTGDTSPASGLAVDRFPVGEHDGDIHYKRTIRVPLGVAQRLGRMAIVQHGVDLNHNGRYDFKAAGRSELDPSLPQEATIPANCGVINPVR